MKKSKWISILGLLLLLVLNGQGRTDTTLSLSRSQWEELRSDLDYTESFKTSEPEKEANEPVSMGSKQYFSDLRYFIYGVLALALLILIVVLVRRTKKNTSLPVTQVAISVDDIDKQVHELDLELLLKDALVQKNYRLAIRIHFLMVIKALSQTGKISWAKEKTNWEYHLELRDKLMADRFRELILNFESFWYGEHQLNDQDYQHAEPLYKELLNHLNPHG